MAPDHVLGLGDSIMCGPEEGAFGVAPRAWAEWLAATLDLPFHRLAQPGATTPQIADELLPRARAGAAVACVHAGTNDVRSVDWDPVAYEAALRRILATLAERSARVCVATIPLDLGRPRAGAKVGDLNAIVRRVTAAHDAVVVPLDGLRGWRHLFPDAVHPTALGQLEIADRAAAAFGLDRRPSALAGPVLGRRADVRYACGRHVFHVARDYKRRIVERFA